MHFDEQPIDARRDGRRRERLDVFRLPGRDAVACARQLQAVRRIINDRIAERSQHRKRAHVDDQVVVAEAEAALGDEHLRVARFDDLGNRVLHVGGREKLPLLQIDRPPGLRRGHDEVGLPRKERGNLQHVGDLRDRRRLIGLVDVGEDRHAEALLDARQDFQSFFDAGTAKRFQGRAIRLVVRRFEDERHAAARCDLCERLGNHRRVRVAFDDARSGNQREGSAAADGDRSGHHACRAGHQTMPASAGRAAPDCVLC